ncbi:diguanylate cyclase (GGDEF)-like protein [Motilibacter rhizosphaerae]|uniref:Diguanylate cyclase (GGDEF)-like protein n=2 Tax=Motilibacter rhizosphaerae TaxID=598652 RepID=A0A4Q7NS43_9ACTN|nr:diguanylate cyclase (GGDEF)-like protein [Motilibacter rhizosphaerae]
MDEWARLRARLARTPGGLVTWAALVLGVVALAALVTAVAAATTAPLAVVPVALAGTAALSLPQRERLVALGAAAATLLVGCVVVALRGQGSVAGPLWLVLGWLLAAGVAEAVAVRVRSLRLALEAARAAVDAVSVRDPLTGVANHHGLELVGKQIVETARRQGDAVYCTFVEIGGLAEARAAHGADAVSDVLVALAEALRAVTRTTDVVARWQDQVFCTVGQGAGVEPTELERRIRRRLGADETLDRAVWSGRITVGGAMLPPWDSGTLETLLVRAAEELRARSIQRRPTAGESAVPQPSDDTHSSSDTP